MFEEYGYGLLEPTPQTPQTPRPKAVVFGDSMSEYVGYNPDGTPNTKYGKSVADVIGANLGIEVENLATGGETSTEALAGGSKFGAFADYIATNKPEYAIIRYGAADAIKSKDPQATLDAVQQMVDIAKANGVTPIIVGVSELYGAQNSKTGNIAGYIDPGAEQRANAINDGLAQIAANNGVSFTDVRSAVSAGKGDLLDGVHSNADFGKKMADAISESIVSVIPEANVPKLPTNVDALSTTEKGQLYNSLVSQGYTDAQIRTAARAESDQDWNALKQIAADVKNTTPAQVERQAQSAAAPETGLLAQGTGMPNQIAQSIQQATQFLNSPENLRLAEGAATMQQVALPGGRSLNVYSDGTAQEFTADGRVKVYNEAGETILNQTQQEYAQRGYLTPVVNALMAAAGGAVLGPAGAGLLSTPAAAAAGAGGTSLLRGGDLEDALKSAALAATAAYGFEQLFPSDALTVAKDAVNMASQGASQDAIKAALIEKGVNAGTAGSIASDAVSGVSVNQIASDFSQIKLGGGTTPPAGGSPNLVNIVASNAPTTLATTAAPGVLGAIAPSLATTSPVVSATTPGLLNQQVQVQSQTGATQPGAASTIPGAAASLLTPTQTVPVTSQTTTTQQNTGPAGAMLGTTITTPTGQTVEIVDRSTKAQTTAPVLPVITSTPVVVQGKTVPVSDVAVPAGAAGAALGVTTPATPTSPFSATDAALAALLLGGAGSLLNQSQSGGFTMDQGLANAIINAPRPTYRGGVGGYQMPGMFQIAPTNVYNPFATTAPFGTGRFGGFSAPITLPRGLV